jgi:hypothetical protein
LELGLVATAQGSHLIQSPEESITEPSLAIHTAIVLATLHETLVVLVGLPPLLVNLAVLAGRGEPSEDVFPKLYRVDQLQFAHRVDDDLGIELIGSILNLIE